MITAGNAYLTLQRGADRLWEDVLPVKSKPDPLKIQAFRFIRNRIEAFFVVLLVGFLMVIDQISANIRMIPGAVLEELANTTPWIENTMSKIPVLEVGQFMLPLIGFSTMALLLQGLLPSRRVPLKPLIPGAFMIGTLLTILNLAVSRSILFGIKVSSLWIHWWSLSFNSLGLDGRSDYLFWSMLERCHCKHASQSIRLNINETNNKI